MKWNEGTKRFESDREPKTPIKESIQDLVIRRSELTSDTMPIDWFPAWNWLQQHLKDGCPHRNHGQIYKEPYDNEVQ